MNTYTIESVNGKTCTHRGSDAFAAAMTHIRVHVTRRWYVGPIQEATPNFWSACDQRANQAVAQRRVRQPFRVVRTSTADRL